MNTFAGTGIGIASASAMLISPTNIQEKNVVSCHLCSLSSSTDLRELNLYILAFHKVDLSLPSLSHKLRLFLSNTCLAVE